MKSGFQKYFLFTFIILLGISVDIQAQSYFVDGLDAAFHQGRRQAFRELLPENGVAVIFNNPVKNRSNDTDFNYRPNSDFYYLTGFREPNAALIIFKNPQTIEGEKVSEIIYVQPRDPRKEQWDGHKNLSAFVPKTVEDIERIMKEEGILQKLGLFLED